MRKEKPPVAPRGLDGFRSGLQSVRSLTLTGSVQTQRIFAWTIRRTEDSTTFGEVVLCPASAVLLFCQAASLKAVHGRRPSRPRPGQRSQAPLQTLPSCRGDGKVRRGRYSNSRTRGNPDTQHDLQSCQRSVPAVRVILVISSPPQNRASLSSEGIIATRNYAQRKAPGRSQGLGWIQVRATVCPQSYIDRISADSTDLRLDN